MSLQKLVLLNGSPKARGGSSGSFGNFILDRIAGEGKVKEIHHVGKALQNEEKWKNLVHSIITADTIILTFPLYWDSLPSHLTRALERIYFEEREFKKVPNFYVIVHNGFPEPWHNETAIEICHCFSEKMRFRWQGALNIGGGATIAGRPLEETGGMTLKLRETLDIAARAISKGGPIHNEVKKRLAKPLYPPWFNIVFGGIGWRRMARKKGAKTPLSSKPYTR